MLSRRLRRLYSPWQEMERVQREMNRLFRRTLSGPGLHEAPCYPAMNVWTNQDGVQVTAELPGVKVEDIEISVVNDTLTVSGTREPEMLQEGETYHRRERGCGKFNRTFQLPYQVESGKVEAVLEKGVLHVTLPRAEADKPKKITIKAG